MSLAKKVVRAGIWLQFSKIVQLASNFAVTLVLARLLPPNIFGLAGIATLYSTFVLQFTMIGITLGIVQKKDVTQKQLSSVFWFNLAFGVLTFLIVFATAPLAANFYNEPELRNLLWVLSITFLLPSFFQIQRRLLEKELRFDAISKIEMISVIGSGVIGIFFALLGFGVYAIIFQSVGLNVFYLIATSYYKWWRPNFVYSFTEIKDLLIFSIKMKVARVGNYFERNIDFLLLSKLFDTALFGLYTLAYRVLYFPVRRLAYVFTEILFPAFSSIQEDRIKIKTGIIRSIEILLIVLLPIQIILIFFSGELVNIVLGSKWAQLNDVLYLFFLVGIFQSIDAVFDSVYPAINKLGRLIKIEFIRLIITGAAVYFGSRYELFGVAVGLIIARGFLLLLNKFFIDAFIRIRLLEIFKMTWSPILAAGVMYILYLVIEKTDMIKINVFLSLIIGLIFYSLSLWSTNKVNIKYYYKMIFSKA